MTEKILNTKVIRRNKEIADFNADKIRTAITKAFVAVKGEEAKHSVHIQQVIDHLLNSVLQGLSRHYENNQVPIHLEFIQDQVELILMREGHHDVARAYVLYRDERTKLREQQSKQQVIEESNLVVSPEYMQLINDRFEVACFNIPEVDKARLIELTLNDLYRGATLEEVENATILASRVLIENDPMYTKVTMRLLLNQLYTEVFENFNGTPDHHKRLGQFYQENFIRYLDKGIEAELLNPELKTFDLDLLIKAIDGSRDNQFTYLGLQTLYDRYFIHIDGKRIECPQFFFMRVAMGLAIGEKSNKTEHAISFYNLLSKFDFMSSTPTLFNSGTLHSQLSSCYISTIADSLDHIYEGIKENALMSKWAGGIGNDWTSVRALGAKIKGTNGQSQGVVPFLKVVNDTCIAVNQCFASDTLVHTNHGLKPIQSVTTDDLVLGISGKYRQVQEVMEYLQIGTMVELKSQSSFKPIKVTSGHPLYVLRGVNPNENLDSVYQKLQRNELSPEWIDAGDLKVGDLIAQVVPSECVVPHDISIEECEKYGHHFASELKRNPYAEIDQRYLHLPKEFIKSFMIAFLSHFVNENQDFVSLNVANHVTAENIRFYLLRVGVLSICSHYKSKDEKSIANGGASEDVFDHFQLNIPITQEISMLNSDKFVKQPTWIHWNGKIYTSIESIRVIDPEVHVFDMLVEGDESYMTEAGLAHNGGKRKGSACVYLESWHLDIEEFLELRKNTGDDRRRTHDMNTANWIPDLFMKRVLHDEDWTLFSPNETPELHETFGSEFEQIYINYEQKADRGELRQFKRIKAVSLWRKMLSMLFETGHPWMTFKDPCNIRSPQQHVGRVHSSNLCVAPETQILTDQGYFEIQSLEDQTVNVWNGAEFSETIVRKTGENQLLLKVKLDNGVEIACTPYHKFYIKKTYKNNMVEKRAGELEQGDILIKYDLPLIEFNQAESYNYAYLHGYFCAKGTYNQEGNPILPLESTNSAVLDALKNSSNNQMQLLDEKDLNNRPQYALPKDLAKKFNVPTQHSVADRINWIAGLVDASGQINLEDLEEYLHVSAMNRDCLLKTRLMLQTLGIESRVRQMIGTPKRVLPNGNGGKRTFQATPIYRLSISASCVKKLIALGLNLNDLVIDLPELNEETSLLKNITVSKVIFEGRYSDTYCFTEPKRHMGMFNGILTGQCTEITLNTSEDEIAVCNLGSVNLLNHLDKTTQSLDQVKLEQTVTTAMRMLDNVIDINFYPVEKAKNSNMRHRPVGMGIMAFQDCLYELDISYASMKAVEFADQAQEYVAYYAYLASTKLAEERGSYSTYDGSLWSKGVLPFESNQELIQQRGKEYIDVDQTIRLDWSVVKDRIAKFGMRNSNCMAIAPTATIANIIGVTSSIEPTYQNLYTKSNLSGEFLILNQYLVNDLKKHNLWNKMVLDDIKYFDGSIQKIDYIPEQIRLKYLTAFEIDANWLIECASRRQKWIDQAQSLNLYLAGVSGKKLDDTYKFAWKKGLKTTYYLRTLGASHVEKSTLSSSQVNKVSSQAGNLNLGTGLKNQEPPAPKFCSIDDPDCESCQ